MKAALLSRAATFLGVASALICFGSPSDAAGVPNRHPASHVDIQIDGDLSDLIAAINADPKAGGVMTSPIGNLYTQSCAFVSGYDLTNGYVFLDSENPDGSPAGDLTLYLGWQVTGVIGDYDGDGDPNGFSNAQGGCALEADEAGTNRDGRTGISSHEAYSIEVRDCVTGDLFRIGLKDNQIINFDNLQVVPGAIYATGGSSLELRIPSVQALFNGNDLCDLTFALTAQAEFDGLGSDRTDVATIQRPISVDVQVTTPPQEVCQGAPAVYTITVTNDGPCHVDDVFVTDSLGTGLTFESSNPPSVGDAGKRTWDFPDANLDPGETIVIELTATVVSPSGNVSNHVIATGIHDTNEAACPGIEDRRIINTAAASVFCGQDLACCRVLARGETEGQTGTQAFNGKVETSRDGTWDHVERRGKQDAFHFRSADARVLSCGNASASCEGKFATVGGTGSYQLAGGVEVTGARFEARVDDNDRSGPHGDCDGPDRYRIRVFDASNVVVFESDGDLTAGKNQIHECKSGGKPEAVRAEVITLERPSPNPFSHTTTIAYTVGGESGESVQIGIYDVAGRLVRPLVNADQAPGRYEITWDGRSNDGTTVTKGVYFLRAHVGGVRMANAARLLHLSP